MRCVLCSVYPSVFSLQNPKSFVRMGRETEGTRERKGMCLFSLFGGRPVGPSSVFVGGRPLGLSFI